MNRILTESDSTLNNFQQLHRYNKYICRRKCCWM